MDIYVVIVVIPTMKDIYTMSGNCAFLDNGLTLLSTLLFHAHGDMPDFRPMSQTAKKEAIQTNSVRTYRIVYQIKTMA